MRRPTRDFILIVVAVILMLGGAVMIFTGPDAAIAIPTIAAGMALTVIANTDKRRRTHRFP